MAEPKGDQRIRLSDLGALFHVEQQTVYTWRHRGELPDLGADGTFSLKAMIKWGKRRGFLDVRTGQPVRPDPALRELARAS